MGKLHRLWKDFTYSIGGVILGIVFLVAAFSKATSPGSLIDQVAKEELDFLLTATQVALVTLALEAGLGTALLLGLRHLWVLLPTSGLVILFLFLTGRNYWLVSQGLRETGTCGCFGELFNRTPAEAFWQDLFLLLPALIFCFWKRSDSEPLPKMRLAIAALVGLAIPSWASLDEEIPFIEAAHQLGTLAKTSRFTLSHSYSVTIDGDADSETQVYESEGSSSFLITAFRLRKPLLLDPRSGTVRRVESELVRTHSRGTIEVLNFPRKGDGIPFTIGSDGVTFEIDGSTFTLETSPSK